MEGKIKSQFTISALFTHVLEHWSLGNKFCTKNKYSSLYWICVSIGSFALGVFLSRDIVSKWYESPVNRFMINKPRHLSENPFPAITICHHDPINSNTMNLASVLGWTPENKTDEEWQSLNIIYDLCHWKHKTTLLDKINPEIVFKVLKEFSIKCQDTIKQIRWQDKIIENPCTFMQPTFVVKNLCYSLNALPYHNLYRQMPYKLQEALQIGKKWSSLTSDWNPDQGYGHNANVPWRINSTGFWNSVEIVLEQSDSFYGCSSKQGFTVYFHSPADVPDYSHDSIKFSKSTHSFVQITTHVTLTDDSIKSWQPEKRGCYYSNEKWLKHNTIYTYTNCYVECQVNNTESLCGCVPLFRINSSFPVCGPNLHSCQASAAVLTEGGFQACKCLPSCTNVDYTLANSIVPKNFSYINNYKTFKSADSKNLASIEVAVSWEHTWPLKRNAEETNIGYIDSERKLRYGMYWFTAMCEQLFYQKFYSD